METKDPKEKELKELTEKELKKVTGGVTKEECEAQGHTYKKGICVTEVN